MPLDIAITPLYRVDGQDQPSLPGLMAAVPPRSAARGRDQDRLVVYLAPAGKAALSSGDCVQAASRAAVAFYETSGGITSALRSAVTATNGYLRERNAASQQSGISAAGVMALAVIRESQLTLLLSGPMHAFILGAEGPRHIFDTLSGRGVGLGERPPYYFSQVALRSGDRLVLCSSPPSSWEFALQDASPASLDATRRRLMAVLTDDVSAVLVQATDGSGMLTVYRPGAGEMTAGPGSQAAQVRRQPADSAAERQAPHRVAGDGILSAEVQSGASFAQARQQGSAAESFPGPSAYAIAPEKRDEAVGAEQESLAMDGASTTSSTSDRGRLAALAGRWFRFRPVNGRETARTIVRTVQASRQIGGRAGETIRNFLPRLLPASERGPGSFASPAMMFIAVLVPLVVVTVASAVYFRYGRSVQYEQYLVQAQDSRAQALSLTDPAAQREAWQRELFYLDKADSYTETSDTRGLRSEAQQRLDQLLGIVRLQFQPVLSNSLSAQIGRLAATDNDLYLLDSARGGIMHLALLNSGFQVDGAFNCAPGTYGNYSVGPLVDILAMPPINTINASVVGVDAAGTLLYCAPGQVAQAVPLPPPDTNWGRVRAFTLDAGNLYVLDAQAHAVWVYVGKDGTFVDRPYFFFGGQIPELEDAIDLAVSADDLYVLHSDGHLSTCSYSRLDTVPTRCVDPASLVNPLPAYRDQDLFSEAHFTQLMFSPAPDPALLLLDSDGQGVFRIAPRSLELQSQLRPVPGRAGSMPQGQVTAMAISPNHVLYFALKDRIYFASDTP